MRHFTITIIILLVVFSSKTFAQGCDGFRYTNDISTTVSITTVQFGQNTTVAGNTQDLYMDIYTPDGDARTDRPVIVYAFGGSFIEGDRETVAFFCETYAKRGYVTAAIDYRIYDLPLFPLPDSLDMMEVVVMAVSDMKAAVRFLRKSADEGNPHGIDPENIIAGGISAGAIVALHSTYISEEMANVPSFITDFVDLQGGINGNTDLPGDSHMEYSSSIQGVINMSGALYRSNFIQEGAPPIVSTHSENDGTVPYGFGTAYVVVVPIVTLEGSQKINEQAQSLSIASSLYSVPDGGHVDFYFEEPTRTEYDNFIKNFVHDNMVCTTVSNEDLKDISDAINVYPNPAIDKVSIVMEDMNEPYGITLVDQLGKIVRQINNVDDSVFELKKNQLTAGMYYLDIRFENEDFAPIKKRIFFR